MNFPTMIIYIILIQVVADVEGLRQQTMNTQDTTNPSDSSILWRACIKRFLGVQIRISTDSMNYDRKRLQPTMLYPT